MFYVPLQLGIDASRFPTNSTDLEEPLPLHGLSQTSTTTSQSPTAAVSQTALGMNTSDTEDDHDVDFDLPELATFGGQCSLW